MQIIFFMLRFILIFFLFLFSINSYADQPIIGQVIFAQGSVKATSPNRPERTLIRRSPVYEKDTLITGNSSTGQIVFTDSSVLSLRANSVVRIDQYEYMPGMGSNDRSVISIIKGGFRTITGSIPKTNPNAYQVNTPVATIGVRGTVYSAYFDSARNRLFAKIDSGSIVMSNSNGQITLGRCTNESRLKGQCGLYGQATSGESPETLQQQPSVFNSDASLPGGNTKFIPGFCIS